MSLPEAKFSKKSNQSRPLRSCRKGHQYFTRFVSYGEGGIIRCHKQRSLACQEQKPIKANLGRREFRTRKEEAVS